MKYAILHMKLSHIQTILEKLRYRGHYREWTVGWQVPCRGMRSLLLKFTIPSLFPTKAFSKIYLLFNAGKRDQKLNLTFRIRLESRLRVTVYVQKSTHPLCSHSVNREYFVIWERYFVIKVYITIIYYYRIITKINILQTLPLIYILKVILLTIESGWLNNVLKNLAVIVVLFLVKY